MKKRYILTTKTGFYDVDHTDQVTNYLDRIGIKYSVHKGVVLGAVYLAFEVNKHVWKIVKNDLDIKIDRVSCSFRD